MLNIPIIFRVNRNFSKYFFKKYKVYKQKKTGHQEEKWMKAKEKITG